MPVDASTIPHGLHPNARPLSTSRRELVTCEQCLLIMTGTWYRRNDPEPCGTEAGYKRHRRDNERACQSCLQGLSRAVADRKARRKARLETGSETVPLPEAA
jgi:hypothetical protein